MKTDELILALAADAHPQGLSLAAGLAVAVGLGAVVAALGMALTLGLRADVLASLLSSPRFVFKFVETGAVAFVAARLALGLARPAGRGNSALLLVPLGLLAGAVGLELFSVPEASWLARLVGVNWAVCLVAVPLLSLGPLALLLAALKRGAPESARRTGFVAGLAAGGIGAFFYAAHCPDDSPLFVAVWYSIAILGMGALGAALGARLLRW